MQVRILPRALSSFDPKAMKAGYLYVLVHPSDPDLYKIGVTILHPEKRLAQHNSQFHQYGGAAQLNCLVTAGPSERDALDLPILLSVLAV